MVVSCIVSVIGFYRGLAQRLQYPLITKYSLNHFRDPTMIYGFFSLITGYWSLWAQGMSHVHVVRGVWSGFEQLL